MADDPRDPPDYEVGHCKPPKHTQFQPGRSGNPQGRPKGSKSLAKIVQRVAQKPVRITGPQGEPTVSILEASLTQMAKQSTQGNLGAQRQLVALVKDSEESLSADHSAGLHENDHAVFENTIQRILEYRSSTKTADPEEEVLGKYRLPGKKHRGSYPALPRLEEKRPS